MPERNITDRDALIEENATLRAQLAELRDAAAKALGTLQRINATSVIQPRVACFQKPEIIPKRITELRAALRKRVEQ